MNRNKVLGKGLSALLQGADIKGVPEGQVKETELGFICLVTIGFNHD